MCQQALILFLFLQYVSARTETLHILSIILLSEICIQNPMHLSRGTDFFPEIQIFYEGTVFLCPLSTNFSKFYRCKDDIIESTVTTKQDNHRLITKFTSIRLFYSAVAIQNSCQEIQSLDFLLLGYMEAHHMNFLILPSHCESCK